MVSTFTTNVQLEEPARGDDVGTWDTPVNANTTVLDLILGGITTISGAAGSVVLAAAQFQSDTITINSTLIASITLTLPTSFKKPYTVGNVCTGSSAFVITLATTAAGGQAICVPAGEYIECFNDGTNIKFKNLDRVGSYWDYAGSSVPNWVSGCTVPPYLNCDGSAVSSGTYPALFAITGGVLPNSKGRARFALDQGAGLISSAATGFSGSSVGSLGGTQTITLGTSNLPAYTPTGSVTAVNLPARVSVGGFSGGNDGNTVTYGNNGNVLNGAFVNGTGTIVMAAQGGVSQPMTDLPPAYIGGLTLIRAG